jgi:hypothetical protein
MDKKWLVRLGDKEHPLYGGVLAEAHDRGLRAIHTELIQIPTEENGHTAIVKAVVEMERWEAGEERTDPPIRLTFEAYGDANPRNVNPRIATAVLRMAETRAKGRALRDACNIGETLLEELGDDASAALPTTPATPHERIRRAGEGTGERVNGGRGEKAGVPDNRQSLSPVHPPTRSPVPSPAPGFEAEFTDGKAKYKREDLLKGVHALIGQAQLLGLDHTMQDPETAPNAGLYEFGKVMKKRVDERRATALETKEEAAG